jgi:Glucuronate isomerase
LLGRDVENGELPNDESLLGPMIRNICYANARNYIALPAGGNGEPQKPIAARAGSSKKRAKAGSK